MLKRTTVYLDQSEVETLKKISFLQSVSMAELIRQGVQELCKTFSPDQKEALAALSEIREDARKTKITPKAALKAALKAQKEVRRERKKSRH